MISLAILFLCITYAYSEDCSTMMGDGKKITESCNFSSIYEDEQIDSFTRGILKNSIKVF